MASSDGATPEGSSEITSSLVSTESYGSHEKGGDSKSRDTPLIALAAVHEDDRGASSAFKEILLQQAPQRSPRKLLTRPQSRLTF